LLADPWIRRTIFLLVGVSALYLGAALVVGAGGLNALSGDQAPNIRSALATIGVFWALTSLGILAIASGLHRPRETALAISSGLLALAAAEAALRLTYPPSWRPLEKLPSSRYHHVHRSDSVMYQGNFEGTDVVVRTNEDGFRSSHSREEFRSYPNRIVILGPDSVAVLNAGAISHSPMLGVRIFDGVVRHYRPTLVLYVLDTTDIGDDLSYEKELVDVDGESVFHLPDMPTASYYGALVQVADPNRLSRHLLRPYRILKRVAGYEASLPPRYDWYDFRLKIGGVVETNRFFIYRHPLEETLPHFERTWAHVTALAAAAKEEGAEFMLVLMPRYHHWNPEESAENWEKDQYAPDEPWQYEYFRFFEERRDQVPFEIFNLLPAFQETGRFPLVFTIDPHLNPEGHSFVGEVLAGHLTESGRLR
jgi:hypothetical protein